MRARAPAEWAPLATLSQFPSSETPRSHSSLSTPLPSAVGAMSTVKAAASRSRPILPPPAGLRARAPSCACHPGSAARSMVSTRRSARRGGNGPLAADGALSELALDAPPPPSVRRRQSRDASPPGWPGRARFVSAYDSLLTFYCPRCSLFLHFHGSPMKLHVSSTWCLE